jgi:hypothetical protein
MNIHDVIPIIIFILYVAAIIHKRRKKKQKGAHPSTTAKKPSRLFAKLGEKWSQVLKEIEKQAELEKRKKTGQATGWERLVGNQKKPRGKLDTELEWESAPTGPLTPPPLDDFHYDPRKDKLKPARNPVTPAAARVRRHAYTKSAYDINDLRKAVVWSEILAPPLALRDPNRDLGK